MMFTVLLCTTLIGQANLPTVTRPERFDPTTLIIVASDRGTPGENEFLILRTANSKIYWEYVIPKGYTKNGVDPEGNVQESGVVPGGEELLQKAFKNTLGEITGSVYREPDKKKRMPAYFSLMLISQSGVKTCELLSSKQQKRLVRGEELKHVFDEIKKVVVGISCDMQDLLQVGTNPYVDEPIVPVFREVLLENKPSDAQHIGGKISCDGTNPLPAFPTVPPPISSQQK